LVREVQDLALDPVMTLVISLGLNVIDLDRCPSYWDVMIDWHAVTFEVNNFHNSSNFSSNDLACHITLNIVIITCNSFNHKSNANGTK
jgi:hypothetical protein